MEDSGAANEAIRIKRCSQAALERAGGRVFRDISGQGKFFLTSVGRDFFPRAGVTRENSGRGALEIFESRVSLIPSAEREFAVHFVTIIFVHVDRFTSRRRPSSL